MKQTENKTGGGVEFAETVDKAIQICAQLDIGTNPKRALEILKEATWIVERLMDQAEHGAGQILHLVRD